MNISISLVGSLHVTGGALVNLSYPRPAMSSQVDVVDLSSGETSKGPPMRNPRFGHAAAASTTSLFLFGGRGFALFYHIPHAYGMHTSLEIY